MNDSPALGAIHLITGTLASTLDHDEGLRRTLEVAIRCVHAAGGSIWHHVPATRQLVCRHAVGPRAAQLLGFVLGDDEGIAGQVFQSRTARADSGVAANPRHAHRVDEIIRHRTRNLVTVPLCYPGGAAVGVLQLVNRRGGDFTERDLTVLAIVADVCAMSLHNADLARQALRTEALGYVAGFSHDIYNKMTSFVSGLPTLRLMIEDVLADMSPGACGAAARSLREDALPLMEWMREDADLVYRYARFIARLAADKPLEIVPEVQDLAETVRLQVDQLRPTARDRRVALEMGGDTPVPCRHDGVLLGSAVYNLINNALDASPDGTVRVTVRREADWAAVDVRDSGRGMPSHVLGGILAGQPVSTRAGGTGLGTMIVRRVADLHGGRLEGESQEGAGTAFTLRLPRSGPGQTGAPEQGAA